MPVIYQDGSFYGVPGAGLQLGETSDTAYRGDRGKTAYDDSQTNKTNIGNLSNLQTTNKSNLVSAINEVKNTPNGVSDFDNLSNRPVESSDIDMHSIVMENPPGSECGFPIMFDERETERQVGWYVNSSGLKKPIYEKTFTGNFSSSASEISLSLPNATMLDIKGYYTISGDIGKIGIAYDIGGGTWSSVWYNIATGKVKIQYGQTYKDNSIPFVIDIRYTKTTDTFS